MPLTHTRSRVATTALLGSLLCALALAPAAGAARAKTVPAGLRVVDGEGRVLAEQTQYTGSGLRLKTDPKAACFGPGEGGSGARAEIPAPTALSLLADAGATTKAVRPLSLTDAFSFGLGLCGIGGSVAPETGFWSLKLNHEASQAGGDATTVGAGDEVLWYLVADYNQPPPAELVLKAKRPRHGAIPVKVLAYGDDGSKSPAAGAAVSGAGELTDARGKTAVAADGRVVDLIATRDGAIASNEVSVCTVRAKRCPAGYAGIVAGTKGRDRIRLGSDPVTVRCGSGRDVVKLSRKTSGRVKLKRCEKVKEVK